MISLKGNLDLIGFPELLQTIELLRKSGTLSVSHREESVILLFSDGLITAVDSFPNEKGSRLGETLIKQGKIKDGDLDDAIKKQRKTGQKLGQILVDTGLCDYETVMDALKNQALSLTIKAFNWQEGTYQFQPNLMMKVENSFLDPVPTGSILLSGTQVIDEWPMLHREIPDENSVFGAVDPEFGSMISRCAGSGLTGGESGLIKQDLEVLARVDGVLCVRELVQKYGFPEFAVYKSLVSLLNAGLIELKMIKPSTSDGYSENISSSDKFSGFLAKDTHPIETLIQPILDDFTSQNSFVLFVSVFTPFGLMLAESHSGVVSTEETEQIQAMLIAVLNTAPRLELKRFIIEGNLWTVVGCWLYDDHYLVVIADKAVPLGAVSRSATLLQKDLVRVTAEMVEHSKG